MPNYRYTAVNLKGENAEGLFEGNDRNAVVAMLRFKGFFPLEIQEVADPKGRDVEFRVRIPLKALAVFCNQLSSVLSAGVPIVQALDIMRGQTEHKKLKQVLNEVYAKIQQGKTLSEAFREHAQRFPELFISMIESGEASGTLEAALAQMGLSMTKQYKINNRVRSAMIYPIALIVVAVVEMLFLLTTIVPKFVSLYSTAGAQLPCLTKITLRASNFVTGNFVLVLLLLTFIVALIIILLKSQGGQMWSSRVVLSLPAIGKQLIKVYSARFTRSLASLSAAGVPIAQAMEISGRNIGNPFLCQKLGSAILDVNKGRGITAPLQELNIFPPMVVSMIHMGEESGTLEQMLSQTAEFFEEEADSAMARLMAMMEPAIIVVLGAIVLVIVLSVVLPMFGMVNYVA